MLNQVVLVGRVKEIDSENNIVVIDNEECLISVLATESIIDSLMNYCYEDTLVGIKGKITRVLNENVVKCKSITLISNN